MANPLEELTRFLSPGTPVSNIITGNGPPSPSYTSVPVNQLYFDQIGKDLYTFNGQIWEGVDNPKGKYDATVAPTSSNDELQGFDTGSFWFVASGPSLYICTSPAAGAATWSLVTAGGGGGIPTIGSSTDNALVRWDGALGGTVQNSNAILTDGGSLSLAVPLSVSSGGIGAATQTANAILIGAGASPITSVGPGTNDQILFGNTGSAPSFGSLIPGSGISIVGKTISATGGTGDVVGPASSVDNRVVRMDGVSGKLIQQSLVAISDTGDVTGVASITAGGSLTLGTPLTVPNGGTGAASLTANALVLGNGAAALSSAPSQADGQLLIGRTGNSPVAANLTTSTPGSLTITNGSGTIDLAVTASGGLSFVDVAGTSQALAINNRYQNNNAALTTFTLPASAVKGSQIEIVGYGSGGWVVAQGAGQQIVFGDQQTTVGASGSLASANRYDNVLLSCVVADTTWKVSNAQGNITFV